MKFWAIFCLCCHATCNVMQYRGGVGGGGGVPNQFPPFPCTITFLNFHHSQSTNYLLNIIFIFDRCHHSLKWFKEPNRYFCKIKMSSIEWITNRDWVTPTLDYTVRADCIELAMPSCYAVLASNQPRHLLLITCQSDLWSMCYTFLTRRAKRDSLEHIQLN